MSCKQQIRQGCQCTELAVFLGEAMQSAFLMAKLLLDHPIWTLNFRADVSFDSFNQILQPPFWCLG